MKLRLYKRGSIHAGGSARVVRPHHIAAAGSLARLNENKPFWRNLADTADYRRLIILQGRSATVETTLGYAWQQPYEAAMLETDRTKLPTLIEAAQTAINARRAEMGGTGSPAELQAIEDAKSGLRILIAETRAL
jgi:hypothetical protein